MRSSAGSTPSPWAMDTPASTIPFRDAKTLEPAAGMWSPMSSTAASSPASTARLPARYPVRYAAGVALVECAHPKPLSSEEIALTTMWSPSGRASTNCTRVWRFDFRTTARGRPPLRSMRRFR